LQSLPTPPAGMSPTRAQGINNAGTITGWASVSFGTHAFVLKNNTYIDLGTLDNTMLSLQSFSWRISEDGHVVGYSQTPSNNASIPIHPFLWFDANSNNTSDAGEMKDLGTLSGVNAYAFDINASGYVVGTSEVSGGGTHAYVWHDDNANGVNDAGEMKDLNGQFSDATWTTLVEARSLNDGGQIVGWGTKSNGETHAFLLTPAGFTPPPCPGASPSPTPTPANQTITVNTHAPANAAYNSQFTVAATASSGLDVTYSSAGACTNTGATFMMTSGTGTCTVKYDQAGNANYNAAPQVTENVTAQKASATITLGNLTQVFDGSPKFATASTTPAGLTVNITYSQNGNPVSSPTSLGAYAVSAVISDTNYQGSTTGTLNIVEPAPVILLETGTSNAAAVDSVTFFRGPFRVTDNFNFSGDHLTRIIIFTLPLANPDQTLSVKASGIDLPIESVGNVTGVSGLNASYIIVKLPQGLQVSQPTTFGLTVTLRNVTSNTADLIITP
jgi:probable HAF family extracellular repeat protein